MARLWQSSIVHVIPMFIHKIFSSSGFIRTFVKFAVPAFAVCLFVPSARLLAAEIVFQNGLDGYEGTRGVNIKGAPEELRRKNFQEASEWLIAGVPHGGHRSLLLLAFSGLTGEKGIPAGAKVIRATLELYKVRDIEDDGQYRPNSVINVYRLLTPFYPEESTFDERTSLRASEQFWGDRNSIEDGPVADIDFDKASGVSARLTGGDEDSWMSWDVTETAARWIRNPKDNHGFLIMANAYWIGGYFASASFDDISLRPRLVVEFSEKGR